MLQGSLSSRLFMVEPHIPKNYIIVSSNLKAVESTMVSHDEVLSILKCMLLNT